jgi:hypothetical protein
MGPERPLYVAGPPSSSWKQQAYRDAEASIRGRNVLVLVGVEMFGDELVDRVQL